MKRRIGPRFANGSGGGSSHLTGAGYPSQMLCRASLAAMLATEVPFRSRSAAACPGMKTTHFMVKLELEPFGRCHPMLWSGTRTTGPSAPKPISDFAGDHRARLHHQIIA